MLTARFDAFDREHRGWSCAFDTPCRVCSATRLDEVRAVVAAAEAAAQAGQWAVVILTYESAPAFDDALRTHAPTGLPPATALLFDAPRGAPPADANGAFTFTPWQPCIARDAYDRAIHAIHAYIAAGHTYQVNYTFPMHAAFGGDDQAWYCALGAAQGAAYSAWIDLGRHHLLSLSPELFFARRGNQILTRPMKGTRPRGRWHDEDVRAMEVLRTSAKDRAENLMITDLIRNDLGRVALPGSVHVPALFEVERYATVLQMTSTVTATCAAGTTLWAVLAALFPCGSVTGAPKVRTMEIIRETEPHARGVYCGAIGLIQPGGDCTFNVPIRTLTLDTHTGQAEFHVGGGIIADSSAAGEFDECRTKAAFLTTPRPAFDLLESLLLRDGEYWLLARHAQRLRETAEYFGFSCAPAVVQRVLDTVRAAHPHGAWKVRLLLDREGVPRCEAAPLAPTPTPWRVAFAQTRVHAQDCFVCNKTTQRRVYDHARAERPDCDDVLLLNERGEVTESTIANLVIEHDGRKLTPARACGLLAGVFREELLARGEIVEAVVTPDDVRRASNLWLINSVRGWLPAALRA
jgi:para-aminobenzoate synthetase/4-amino-4-deoxychorismate lyase